MQGCRHAKQLAPGIIGIAYHLVAVGVKNSDDVVLTVADVVIGSIVIIEAEDVSVFVIEEVKPVGARDLRDNAVAVQIVLGRYSVHRFLCADAADVSVSYLGRIFKSVTGKTPIDYLIDIRISKARNLLLDGFSVTETSQMVGFNDIYYFSKAFKKREGVSPSAFYNSFS